MDDLKSYVESLDECDLRNTLSKYIEDVPPITVTTRPLLESMLSKYLKEATVSNDTNQNTWAVKQDSLPEQPAITIEDVTNPDIDDIVEPEDFLDVQNLHENEVETDQQILTHRYDHQRNLHFDDKFDYLQFELPSYKREPLHSKLSDIDYQCDETFTRKTDTTVQETDTTTRFSNWKGIFIKFILIMFFIGTFMFFMSYDIFYTNPINHNI